MTNTPDRVASAIPNLPCRFWRNLQALILILLPTVEMGFKYAYVHGLFARLFLTIQTGWLPTVRAVLHRPTLLLRPRELSRTFMAHVWVLYGDEIDDNMRQAKDDLIRKWARGVVLDLGAGHGHLARYLDRPCVSAYVALEPNALMHARLRAEARAAGFVEEDGSFVLLACGAEDTDTVCAALAAWARQFRVGAQTGAEAGAEEGEGDGQVVDTLVSVLTLCSVPRPRATLGALVRRTLRAPGGQLLFHEHVRSPCAGAAKWQDALAPLWALFFDGCWIGVDGVGAIRDAGKRAGAGEGEGGWETMEVWGVEGDDPESLFWHQAGRCVKGA
ncbi:hypothetical protein DFH11DRAFT_1814751 [Phellopilus nigrolimitatus]|nr:hypothetical protein DFH11DRAFT_1814751 [Phellopilus nigrolimitatus]